MTDLEKYIGLLDSFDVAYSIYEEERFASKNTKIKVIVVDVTNLDDSSAVYFNFSTDGEIFSMEGKAY